MPDLVAYMELIGLMDVHMVLGLITAIEGDFVVGFSSFEVLPVPGSVLFSPDIIIPVGFSTEMNYVRWTIAFSLLNNYDPAVERQSRSIGH